MCCYVALAEILNRSVVYVKEFDPKRIGIRKKQIQPEHVKLWNIILHMFDNMQDNGKITSFEDLTEYIKGSRILSSSVRISDMPCDGLEYTAAVNTDSKALAAMRILVSKIDIMLCSGHATMSGSSFTSEHCIICRNAFFPSVIDGISAKKRHYRICTLSWENIYNCINISPLGSRSPEKVIFSEKIY